MRYKITLLGSAMALACTLAIGPSLAQAPTPQAAPGQSSVSEGSQPSGSETQAPDTQTRAAPAKHTSHHRHLAMRSASRESSSERQQTKELNEQQLAQRSGAAQQSPMAAGNPQSAGYGSNPSAAPQDMNGPVNSPSATPQSPDNSGSASPGDQQPQKGALNTSQTGNTQLAQNAASTPEASHSAVGSRGTMALTQLQNPQQTLASAKVQGTTGQQIGTVQQIRSDAGGTLTKVLVKLDPSLGMGNRSVWVGADQMQYQPDNNSLTTTLSAEQLSTM